MIPCVGPSMNVCILYASRVQNERTFLTGLPGFPVSSSLVPELSLNGSVGASIMAGSRLSITAEKSLRKTLRRMQARTYA